MFSKISLILILIIALTTTILISLTHCQTLLDEADEVSFSGSNYGSSTGWVYSQTIDSAIQWGRLYYIMDPISATGDNYVHITFMAIANGLGTYVYTDGSTNANVTQQMRVVDSVGSTLKMQNTPTQSMHYILNMDTGTADGELDVETDYIYYYDTENWTCMEWYTNFNSQIIQLYENSVLTYEVNNDLTFTGPSTGASISFRFPRKQEVKIGMYTYNGVAVSGSFKGVKIAGSRIGCDDSSDTGGGNTDTSGNTGGNTGNSGDTNTDDSSTSNGDGNSNNNANEISESDNMSAVGWSIFTFVLIFGIVMIVCLQLKKMGYIVCNDNQIEWKGKNSPGNTQEKDMAQHTSNSTQINRVISASSDGGAHDTASNVAV